MSSQMSMVRENLAMDAVHSKWTQFLYVILGEKYKAKEAEIQ